MIDPRRALHVALCAGFLCGVCAIFAPPAVRADAIACNRANTVELATYCQQKRAVDAATVLNVETAAGIVMSTMSTIALIVTVYYSRRSTMAAVQAAHAARISIEDARDSSLRELRPYVAQSQIDNIRYENPENPGVAESRYLRVVWTNLGSTPASNVRAKANHAFIDGPLPDGFEFPNRDVDDFVGTLGPGRGFTSPTANLDFDDIRATMAGTKTLHVWGWVEYDGYGSKRRLRTEYHATVSFWGAKGPESLDLNIDNTLRKRFNGIDETCHRFEPD